MSTHPENAAAARAEALAIVEQALEATGLSPTALANAAGVAPSTINRFRKHPDAPVLGTTTLAKLARLAKLGPLSSSRIYPRPSARRKVQKCA